MFAALVAYKDAHGDCKVPRKWPENQKLASWVSHVRQRKKGTLSEDRIRRLDELGFVWVVIDARWEEMFAALLAYKDAHGDCNVPAKCSEFPKLGIWVHSVRNRRKKRTLSQERIRLLDEIGFVWVVIDVQWEEMFAALVAYKDAHGDCKVPGNWPENRKLGIWVDTERQRRKKGTLSKDRIRRLDEPGFVWVVIDARWEEMFVALVAYKDAHGDCNVPRGWPDNPKLATWVGTQRLSQRKGALGEERIRRLDKIGFRWRLRNGK